MTPPSTPAAPARRAAREPSVDGSADLQQERARRKQAESAVLSAEQRAATAEGKLLDAEAQLGELQERVAALDEEVRAAVERAQQLEQSAREGERWRRQVDQLRADLRRLRGGAVEESAVPESSPGALAEMTQERDRLRQRVSDLEAEVARVRSEGSQGRAVMPSPPHGSAPANDADSALLRRKVEQLTAELRRLRGGQAPQTSADEERVAALEARIASAELERDEARRLAAERQPAGAGSDAATAENEKLRRMIDQLTAENRRLRQGSGTAPPAAPVEDPRLADLTSRLERAERERDTLKRAGTGSASGAPQVGEAVSAVDDALADLRASLRAARDEVGVLSVEAPSDSVSVLKDALDAATEQVERAREKTRDLKKSARLA